MSEKCSICRIGKMDHPDLYTWTCSYCGYSYYSDPTEPIFKPVKILNHGTWRRKKSGT